MHKYHNVRISDESWAKLKQRALDERCTLREIVERAAHQYLGTGGELRSHHQRVEQAAQTSAPRELSYDPEAS